MDFSSTLITQVGSTGKRTMAVLPSAQQKQQKIAIGDDTGVVTCFTAKNGVHELVFQSNPGEREVTALCLGGSKLEKDQIYVAHGQVIHGYKKKGKDFFKFNTSLNEDIMNMAVEDLNIWTSGEYVYNVFDNCKDSHFFMSSDRINHMEVASVSGASDYNAILACKDRTVRVLQGGDVYYESHVDGPVTSVMNFNPQASNAIKNPSGQPYKQVIYGTENGLLGQLLMDADTCRKGWQLPNSDHRGAITCLTQADVLGDGVSEIIVGRDDGSDSAFEVYGFGQSTEPQRIYTKEMSESVTSVGHGNIMNVDRQEMVASTYSGKVTAFSFDKRAQGKSSSSSAVASSSSSNADEEKGDDRQSKIRELRSEIDKLKAQVAVQKEKYQGLSSNVIAVQTQFKIQSGFRLIPSEACYLLSLEIQHPIEVVTLQSNLDLILLDVDSNIAICSRSPPDRENGNALLATYRCQESVNRLEIKIRTTEGRIGELNAYVVPKLAPKTCQCANFQIKPLSLHEKVQNVRFSKAVSALKISGDFSLAEIHQWASCVLPEVPPRLTTEEAKFEYHSAFLGTSLVCEYKRGTATFRSDNVSTISIVKDALSREATNAKSQINISVDIQDECVSNMLTALQPRLDHHFSLAKKQSLIEALKELSMAENEDVSFLSPAYQEILKNADSIEREHKEAPRHLEFLRVIVSDLLVDWHKLRGRNPSAKLAQLHTVLGQTSSNSSSSSSSSKASASSSSSTSAATHAAYSFEALINLFGLGAGVGSNSNT